jgi:hypothetical protein
MLYRQDGRKGEMAAYPGVQVPRQVKNFDEKITFERKTA